MADTNNQQTQTTPPAAQQTTPDPNGQQTAPPAPSFDYDKLAQLNRRPRQNAGIAGIKERRA